MGLTPEETELVGEWVVTEDEVSTTRRIELLTRNRLELIVSDASGWETLYRDPRDGRYWELTYPHGEYHGGGPPRLAIVSKDEAKRKYGIE